MNISFKKSFLLGVLTLLGLTHYAVADDFKVYSPESVKGEFALENNFNYSGDHRDDMDNYYSNVIGAEYGFSNQWKTEFSAEIEKEAGDHTKLTHLKLENIILPWARGENWLDVGLYFELEAGVAHGAEHNAEFKLLLEKSFGRIANTANLIVNKEFGPNHSKDTGGGFAWQTRYRMDKTFEPGFEYYADFTRLNGIPKFDEQDHRFGPSVQGKIGNLRYDTAILFGVSNAAQDTTFKLNLEYEF